MSPAFIKLRASGSEKTFDNRETDPCFDGLDWRASGHRYFSYNLFLRKKFGGRRVHKVSLDAGFTCPNVDGTVAIGGCTFCDNRSFSPSRRVRRQDILTQLEVGMKRLRHRYEGLEQFIAYFQPATNTYAAVD